MMSAAALMNAPAANATIGSVELAHTEKQRPATHWRTATYRPCRQCQRGFPKIAVLSKRTDFRAQCIRLARRPPGDAADVVSAITVIIPLRFGVWPRLERQYSA